MVPPRSKVRGFDVQQISYMLVEFSLPVDERTGEVVELAAVRNVRGQVTGQARRVVLVVGEQRDGPAVHVDQVPVGAESDVIGPHDGEVDVVLLHDAARPLVTPALIADVVTAARNHGGTFSPCRLMTSSP